MIEYEQVVSLIGTLGFPIVAYGAMFWYMIKQDKDHKDEMDKMSAALESNTIALQKLTDIVDKNSN